MVIAFPFAFGGKETHDQRVIGEMFVRVTRRHIKAEIVQMSDDVTEAVTGVDSCFRVTPPPFTGDPSAHKAAPGIAFGIWYFDAMASFPAKEFLRLDYDVLVREDVSDVFDGNFDVALREMKGRVNNGVIFVKNKEFFKRGKEEYLKTGMDNWQDCQTATQAVIDSGEFRVKKLGEAYNMVLKPERMDGWQSAKLLHFKGQRKGLMVDYFK